MPTVSYFYGIAISMFFGDHNLGLAQDLIQPVFLLSLIARFDLRMADE